MSVCACVQALDDVWLRDGSFVAGQAQISIADLLLACEVEQLCLLDGAVQVGGLAPGGLVGGWPHDDGDGDRLRCCSLFDWVGG